MDLNKMVKDAKERLKRRVNASAKRHLKEMKKEFVEARKRLGIPEEA